MEPYLENLKTQLLCSLCKFTLTEPKLVDCFHVFCKLCVKRNAEADQQDYIFKCPQCDSTTLLQDLNDVEDLQNSPIHSRILSVLEFVENQKICSVSSSHPEALWQCLDCNKSLCEECLRCHAEFTTNHQVVSLSDLKKEDIDKLLKKELFCETHGDQNVELYCQDCDKAICQLCLKEHHHFYHKILALQDIIAIETNALSKNLAEIKKMTADEKEKKRQEKIALMIKRDGKKAKQQVKDLTDKIVKTTRNDEQQLLNNIQQSITKAERNLRIITHPSQVQDYIKYFLENGTASEMIESRHNKSFQSFTYEHFEESISGIEFKSNKELCEQVKHGLGMVRMFKKPDPKMSSIKVVPTELEATKPAKVVVELKTSEGEATQEALENIAIQFTPEDDVKVEEIQMTDDGEITVDFTPRVPGQLTAGITLHGNPVCNSPLVMLVKPQEIQEITGHSKLRDALNTGSKNFEGIAVNQTKSKIVVADFGLHCVRVFSMEGDLLLTYGSEGGGQGQLNGPDGLAFLNAETDLVIADSGNHRVCIVNTTTGHLVRSFGSFGTGYGQFKYPSGVHVDDKENIIVCDGTNKRVQVFTKDGEFLYQFSVPGCPYSVVTHNGLFYVSNNSVIHVIDQTSTTVNTITIEGKDVTNVDDQYSLWGLAIDRNGENLLICDNGASLIHKFTMNGRYVGSSGALANIPRYIAELNQGQVICTTDNGVMFF